MADYAGAKAAILARFRDRWTRTPIALPNGPDIKKTSVDGDLIPWVYFEVVSADSSIKGVGRPGDHQWVYDGLIQAHVFVPIGSGTELADELAVAAGEIFRAAEFYRETPGCCVRSWSPRCDDGDSGADDGNWWRVTCTVPFEYLHRG